MTDMKENKLSENKIRCLFFLLIENFFDYFFSVGGGQKSKITRKRWKFSTRKKSNIRRKNAPENLVNKIYTSSPYTNPQ